jgi:hypothetical protein
MASQLDITKLVAQHLNERWDNIDTVTDGVCATQVDLVFDREFEKLVTSHPWVFAVRYVDQEALTLASGVELPQPWLAALPYPDVALKVLSLVNPLGADRPSLPFKVAWFDYDDDDTDEQLIFNMVGDAKVRYISNSVTIADADRFFEDALSYTIAARVCLAVTGSNALQQRMETGALVTIRSAQAHNAIEENEHDRDIDPDWLIARG